MGRSPRFSDSGTGDRAILQKGMTVGDAKHLIRNEGGPLTPRGIAIQVSTVLAVAVFSARAIVLGQATVWHLLLPMVAEYLVLLLTMPVVSLYVRDRELKKDTKKGLILIGVILALVAGWITIQSYRESQPWPSMAAATLTGFRDWIVDAKMQWPILAAVSGRIGTLPSRIAAFHRYGPPFVPIGLGCAMRFGLFVLGLFFIPWVLAMTEKVGPGGAVWALWGLILVAEAAALWMHLDLQTQLKKRGIEV